LILVDSSVWVDFFSASPGPAGAELRRMIDEGEPFALTGIIVAEVLQGLRRAVRPIEQYLQQWELIEPKDFATYCRAAAIYRTARANGVTLSGIDTLIAAIALEHGMSLFSLDQDFVRVGRLTGLALYRF